MSSVSTQTWGWRTQHFGQGFQFGASCRRRRWGWTALFRISQRVLGVIAASSTAAQTA